MVPVEEAEDAEDESSSWLSLGRSLNVSVSSSSSLSSSSSMPGMIGDSAGRAASFAFAKALCRSLICGTTDLG